MKAPITIAEAWNAIAYHYGWTPDQLAQAVKQAHLVERFATVEECEQIAKNKRELLQQMQAQPERAPLTQTQIENMCVEVHLKRDFSTNLKSLFLLPELSKPPTASSKEARNVSQMD